MNHEAPTLVQLDSIEAVAEAYLAELDRQDAARTPEEQAQHLARVDAEIEEWLAEG